MIIHSRDGSAKGSFGIETKHMTMHSSVELKGTFQCTTEKKVIKSQCKEQASTCSWTLDRRVAETAFHQAPIYNITDHSIIHSLNRVLK